jgi:hypothetical protein
MSPRQRTKIWLVCRNTAPRCALRKMRIPVHRTSILRRGHLEVRSSAPESWPPCLPERTLSSCASAVKSARISCPRSPARAKSSWRSRSTREPLRFVAVTRSSPRTRELARSKRCASFMEVVVVRTFHGGKKARHSPARISGSVAVDVRPTRCVDAPAPLVARASARGPDPAASTASCSLYRSVGKIRHW